VSDIEEGLFETAAAIAVGARLAIEIVDEDPAFLHGTERIGWLAVNIEEVGECLRSGWSYEAEVLSNNPSPAGPIILTNVTCKAPTR